VRGGKPERKAPMIEIDRAARWQTQGISGDTYVGEQGYS